MKELTKTCLIAAPILTVFLTPIVLFLLYLAAWDSSNEGSPELATEWRDEFAAIENPADAINSEPAIDVVEFENGEWIFGRAQDSHGAWRRGRGTVVVKDSNGEIHAFFEGHVCGGGYLNGNFGGIADLESFYDRLEEEGFQEYDFDETDQ